MFPVFTAEGGTYQVPRKYLLSELRLEDMLKNLKGLRRFSRLIAELFSAVSHRFSVVHVKTLVCASDWARCLRVFPGTAS